MNEIRSRHLVERAALRLREELGLSAATAREAPGRDMPGRDMPGRDMPGRDMPGRDMPAREAGGTLVPGEPPSSQPLPPPTAEKPVAEFMQHPDLPRADAAAAEVPPMSVPQPVTMAVLQSAGLALGGSHRSRVAEEFSVGAGALLRALRAAQKEAQGPAPAGGSQQAAAFGNVLLVTSAKPGEGKTFSALNLAATLAHNGLARVVLADIDSKPSSLTSQLGLDGRTGLFDLAANPSLKPDALLVGTAIRDLSVLPIGTRDPAGGSQGLARKLSTAIERVARRLSGQVIILDAPPCLATSEPSALAPMVGLVALVVEAERTQREEIENALDMVATCANVMLLLNKIRGTSGHAFGYYDYYGA